MRATYQRHRARTMAALPWLLLLGTLASAQALGAGAEVDVVTGYAAVQADASVDAPALPPAPGLPAAPGLADVATEHGLPGDVTRPLGLPQGDEALSAQVAGKVRAGAGADSGAVARVLERPEAQAVVGAGAVAGLALMLGRPFLAWLPLYSRLDKQELLEHPVRRDLMKAIAQEPGVNMSDLQTRFDLGWGALLYHLQRLEAQGLVVSHRWGRSRRFFLNERVLESKAEGIRALKAPNAWLLAERVLAQPGATQEELAQGLGLSRSVVSKYATRLAQASLVQREMGRNCLRLFPTGELKELLHTLPRPPTAQVGPPVEPVPAAELPAAPLSQGAPAALPRSPAAPAREPEPPLLA